MRAAVVVLLLVSQVCAASVGRAIEVMRVIGMDDDAQIMLHHPTDLNFASSGEAFVLNEGDGTIIRLNSDWSLVGQFGGLGEAPGKVSMPNGMVVFEDEIWVLSPWRFTVFSGNDGGYLRTIRLEEQVLAPRISHGKIVATAREAAQMGVVIEPDGTLAHSFGPSCDPTPEGSLEGMLRCSEWIVLPAKTPGDAVLVDTYDGYGYLLHSNGEASTSVDLGLGRGWTEPGRMRFKSSIADMASDGSGGFLALAFPGNSARPRLYRYDESFNLSWHTDLPDEVLASEVRVSPRGEVCFVANSSSLIFVCRLSEP